MRLRPPALAGTWYPDDATALGDGVDAHLGAAAPSGPAPKAVVAPHAGLVYSGPVAGVAYAELGQAADVIERIVLLGPAHRVPVRGLCAPSVDGFVTPLGSIPLDRAAIADLADLPQVFVDDEPHRAEHSLEMHLPFLQRSVGDFTLIPLVVGSATSAEVAQVLQRLWGGPETRIVISSDLSHFHDYATACIRDRQTTEAIEALDGQRLHDDSACGRVPLRGLLRIARERKMTVKTLDVRNSGDTAGSRDRVVGYGAWGLHE